MISDTGSELILQEAARPSVGNFGMSRASDVTEQNRLMHNVMREYSTQKWRGTAAIDEDDVN